MNYNSPDVYVQDVKAGSQSIAQASSSVGAMFGVTRNGLVGEMQLVSSFTEFLNLYANGLDTGFMENSDLAYAVHGFFTNGGTQLYIGRVVSKTATTAQVTTESGITAVASSAGAWGDEITIKIAKNEDWTESNPLFDVTVAVGSSDSVTIKEVTLETIALSVLTDKKASKWLKEFTLDKDLYTAVKEETIKLTGGSDGIADLVDSDFTDSLELLSTLDDVTLVAIPGQTSLVVNDALMAYCDNHNLFPILDMPMGSTTKATKDYRKSISAKGGCLAYPWGKMNDPLTNTLRTVPACGHVMGVYARIIKERGVHKAPAGTEAVVRGFVAMERPLTKADLEVLNPVGVVCIMSRPNAGIVIWGARALTSDTTMRYVSDVLLNYNIKRSLYTGTQFAVFEPNTETLWSSVTATCNSFLESLRLQGALKGTKETAYYVTCNATNNTDDSINEGILNIEIGYAPAKPAEFVVIKLAHSMES